MGCQNKCSLENAIDFYFHSKIAYHKFVAIGNWKLMYAPYLMHHIRKLYNDRVQKNL